MMQLRGQLEIGSPRNITINVLDANTFFTLDYEQNHPHQPKSKTHAIGFHQQKSSAHNTTPKNSLGLDLPVKSAQYNRKTISIPNSFRITNMYTRIKKVDGLIEQRKRMANTSLEFHHSPKHAQKDVLPQLGARPQRKQGKPKLVDVQPQCFIAHVPSIETSPKKIQRTPNLFSENYKNRRKLAERVSHKRASNTSPLRKDMSPVQYASNEAKEKKYWSPYSGKLILKRNIDFLKQSVTGNRINYSQQDPEKIERYREQKSSLSKNKQCQ